MNAAPSFAPDNVLRTAKTEADIGSARAVYMDFNPLLKSSGYSVINILPKKFDQSHRVVEFNVDTVSNGGGDCWVHGFIARTFVDTKAGTNSCGIIVGTKQDDTKGEKLLFRPFFGAQNEIHEVQQRRISPSNLNVTRALGFSRCFGVYGLIGARLDPAISMARCDL